MEYLKFIPHFYYNIYPLHKFLFGIKNPRFYRGTDESLSAKRYSEHRHNHIGNNGPLFIPGSQKLLRKSFIFQIKRHGKIPRIFGFIFWLLNQIIQTANGFSRTANLPLELFLNPLSKEILAGPALRPTKACQPNLSEFFILE